MLQICVETRLGTMKSKGFSSNMKRIVGVFLVVSMLVLSAWAQGVVYSSGVGPRFSVSPAIVVPDSNGNVMLNIQSKTENMQYTVSLEGKKVFEGQYLNLSAHLSGMYEYLQVKGWEKGNKWETSTATILVLSPAFKVGNLLSLYATQTSSSETNMYVVIGPCFGRKELKLYLDGHILMDQELSASDDSPLIFEKSVAPVSLQDGTHILMAKLTTIYGITKVQRYEFFLEKKFTPIIESFEITPNVFPPKRVKMNISLHATNVVKLTKVWINDTPASLKNGMWQTEIDYDFLKAQSGKKNLPFVIKFEDEAGNVTSISVATTVYIDNEKPNFKLLLKSGNQSLSSNEENGTITIFSWSLPTVYTLEFRTLGSSQVPVEFDVSVDGKNIGVFRGDEKAHVTLKSYGRHVIHVRATDLINGLTTTKDIELTLKAPSFPSWGFIALVMASIVALLLLTFY